MMRLGGAFSATPEDGFELQNVEQPVSCGELSGVYSHISGTNYCLDATTGELSISHPASYGGSRLTGKQEMIDTPG
jgi:hypothetical protein